MTGTRFRLSDIAWGALGLALLAAGWSWAHAALGDFVMPSLSATYEALRQLLDQGIGQAVAITLLHALGGGLIALFIGFALGLIGGLVRPAGSTLYPMITAILGIPPVAWVVLALLWFGPGLFGPMITVTIATAPIIFIATMHGVRNRDKNLQEMAQVFRLPRRTRFFRILLPGLGVHIAPALSTVLALSWKVALTAELLGDGSGIGGRFATARAYLNLPEAMAWILLLLIFVLVIDGLVTGLLRRWTRGQNGASRKAPDAAYACPGIRGRFDA